MSEVEMTVAGRQGRVLPGWRLAAARLAAELLCVVTPGEADHALDLRMELLDFRTTPERLLRVFLQAKSRLESGHYLLFYRLRRVLEPALGLEVEVPSGEVMRLPVDFRFREVDHLLRRVRQEQFEHSLAVASPDLVRVSVIWRLAPAAEAATAG